MAKCKQFAYCIVLFLYLVRCSLYCYDSLLICMQVSLIFVLISSQLKLLAHVYIYISQLEFICMLFWPTGQNVSVYISWLASPGLHFQSTSFLSKVYVGFYSKQKIYKYFQNLTN